MKKIFVVHYRIGGTDGVSLEIEKRKEILKRIGLTPVLVAGPLSKNVDYIIEELEFDYPEINKIKKNSFFKLIDYENCDELLEDINKISNILYQKLKYIVQLENPEYLILHNIFSHGRHISAAKSFYKIINEFKIPAIAFNHDFYWDRDIYKNVTCKNVKEYLNKYVPPIHKFIKHVVINSVNKKKLKKYKKINSVVIPDLFYFPELGKFKNINNFNRIKKIEKNDKNNNDNYVYDYDNKNNEKNIQKILNKLRIKNEDIVFLHATRIVERKAIEIAVDFVDYFYNNELLKNKRIQLYNGKKISDFSEVVFLIAGYAEKDSLKYLKFLKEYAKSKNVRIEFIGNYIKGNKENNDLKSKNNKIKIETNDIDNKSNETKIGTNDINRKSNETKIGTNDINNKSYDINIESDNINSNYNEIKNNDELEKISLWDCYKIADVITYTSINEGFGNQFLEAIWAKKPIVLFEYPVFIKDIKKNGFFYISLGKKVENYFYKPDNNNLNLDNSIKFCKVSEYFLKKASKKLSKILFSKNTIEKINKNFNIAYKKYSADVQSEIFKKLLE